jgi:hypothetical protein
MPEMSRMMMARHRHRTDPGTAERLAAGRLDPDDTPPGYRRVAALLGTAGMTPGPRGTAEATDIAAMAAAIREVHTPTPNSPRRKSPMLPNIAAAKALAVLSAFVLPATAAAAATGHLPSAVQDKVANAVDHVGFNLPGGDDAEGADHADGADAKGASISDTARNTDATGVEKGAEISGLASHEGASRAGEEDHGAPESNPAGVDTPSSGGIGTAGDPNSNAVDSANDAASTGSENAEGHPTADNHPTAAEHPTADSHPAGRP